MKDYFLSNITNTTTDAEVADQYEIMRSYLEFGYSMDKWMEFQVQKSVQPTYYLRYVHNFEFLKQSFSTQFCSLLDCGDHQL